MTGPNEQRLIDFADTGSAWDMPGNLPLVTGLQSMKQVLQKIAENPGVMGQTGDAASTLFGAAAVEVQEQITWVQVNAAIVISQANSVRERARESLANLPQGSMTEGQAAAVRGATVGATLVLGPVAFLAGEGAAAAINGYLSNQREEAAAQAMSTHAAEMDEITLKAPPRFQLDRSGQTSSDDPATDGTTFNSGGGGGGRSGTPTFQPAPIGGPSGFTPGGGGGGELPGGGEGPGEYGPFHVDVPQANLGPRPPIDLGSIPPTPTPDGPLNGSPMLPGVIPAAPGTGGLTGGAGAGLGSGLTAGLVAGGGGAAALANLARGAGASGGSLFGGGTATSGTAARSGGLLGKTAPGGSGLGARGVGGLAGGGLAGGGTAGSGTGGSSAARGAGMRAGGLAGAGGTGGTGATGATGAAGGGSRGVGGMGGPGSRSDRRNEAARGLGGPIAPRMEDDEEIGPRSENAQAGGRDD